MYRLLFISHVFPKLCAFFQSFNKKDLCFVENTTTEEAFIKSAIAKSFVLDKC